jgi:hypothetical protein
MNGFTFSLKRWKFRRIEKTFWFICDSEIILENLKFKIETSTEVDIMEMISVNFSMFFVNNSCFLVSLSTCWLMEII